MTDVTVVTPTRDRAEILLAHALPSALAQEDVSFELVVVDDGSTDDTASWLAELGDERVRVVRHEASRGTAAARNAGIAAARGDWVAFLDDDDLWAPTYLRRMLDAAGDAGWVYCAGVVVDGAGDVVDTLVAADPTTVRTAIRHGNVVGGGSALLARTDLLRRLGGLDETLVYVEDWDLCIRLADAAPGPAGSPVAITLAFLASSTSNTGASSCSS